MTDEDVAYLANFVPNTLYVIPASQGAYGKLVSENEVVLGEIEVTTRSRIAVSAFFVDDKDDYDSFKVTKLKFHATYGWRADGEVQLNRFGLSRLKTFVSVLSGITLKESQKAKITLDSVHVETLGAILASTKGPQLLKDMSNSPELVDDIYALATKRAALGEFEVLLGSASSEAQWQSYFELNPWIFGLGLKYLFLEKLAAKMEATTTGYAFDRSGKRVDALMRTRAEVSQSVLVEIKRSDTELLKRDQYRPGVWGVSSELSDAVVQVQKTAHDFARNRFRQTLKDAAGDDTNESIYIIEPRAILVVGRLGQIASNEDKVACFELYRRKITAPEIVTFDELLFRARHIVGNLTSVGEEGF